MALQPGETILDKYRIVKTLGEGAMGRVWLAEECIANKRLVAIKEPLPKTLNNDASRDYFERELEISTRLYELNVPHVVRAITVEPFEGYYLLVMDYKSGGDLAKLIEQHPASLPIERAVSIALDVLAALDGAHKCPQQIIHRDVKPSNILLDNEDVGLAKAYVTDFGFAQLPSMSGRSRLAAPGHPNTPWYAAPEQLNSGAPLKPAADLYAVGCVLWEMLTGQKYSDYRQERGTKALRCTIRRASQGYRLSSWLPGSKPSVQRRDVPPWLDAVVMKALRDRPEDRWQSADEMTRAIKVGQQKDFQRTEKIKRRQQAKAQGLALVHRLVGIERSVGRQLDLAQNRWRQATIRSQEILRRSWSSLMQGTRNAKLSRSWWMLVPFIGLLLVAISMVLIGTPDLNVPDQAMPKTDMEMVNVPAGEFVMGSPFGYRHSPNESPQRSVYVNSFSIDKTEVTVAQYRRCVEDEACSPPVAAPGCNYQVEGKSDHPINCVTWHQARTYCLWVNKRLPSEAEWEKAARGTDARVYPWGNDWDAAKVNSKESGISATVAVGVFQLGASPYGALDMAGNVWEWTEDWYNTSYYEQSPVENPRGPDAGETRVLRGGAWLNTKEDVTVTRRVGLSPDGAFTYAGFRCAHSP